MAQIEEAQKREGAGKRALGIGLGAATGGLGGAISGAITPDKSIDEGIAAMKRKFLGIGNDKKKKGV